jgi:hypothetical protein
MRTLCLSLLLLAALTGCCGEYHPPKETVWYVHWTPNDQTKWRCWRLNNRPIICAYGGSDVTFNCSGTKISLGSDWAVIEQEESAGLSFHGCPH